MLSSLLVALAVLTVRGRFNDLDLWWHLKTGEIIWTTHTIPTTDLFSYTTNHHAWIPHEWLVQVLICGAYRWGGYSGLMLWFCFFTAALLVAGYILCSLYSGNSKTAFAQRQNRLRCGPHRLTWARAMISATTADLASA